MNRSEIITLLCFAMLAMGISGIQVNTHIFLHDDKYSSKNILGDRAVLNYNDATY